MRLLTVEQIRKLENDLIGSGQTSSEKLMQTAAEGAARVIVEKFSSLKKMPVLILAGPGKNGEDARWVSRILKSAGFEKQEILSNPNDSVVKFEDFGLIIDGVFGTGLSRPVSGAWAEAIAKANLAEGAKKIALDIPSGLDANCGIVCGIAFRADLTLTFGTYKPGMFLNDGDDFCGEKILVKIGFSNRQIIERSTTDLVTLKQARKILPIRSQKSNKSHFGRTLVVGGSEGMEGAAILSCLSAYRMGSGYVEWRRDVTPSSFVAMAPEILTGDLRSANLEKVTSIVLGPGLSFSTECQKFLRNILSSYKGPLILDAGALKYLETEKTIQLGEHVVLTPHSGELGRLLGVTAAEVEKDRIRFAQLAAQKWGCNVLLKGFRTVLSTSKRSFIIFSGNVSLAKAGTGDVLAGFIGSLASQGLSAQRAAILGAFIHGRIADRWVRRYKNSRTLVASDLVELVNYEIQKLEAR